MEIPIISFEYYDFNKDKVPHNIIVPTIIFIIEASCGAGAQSVIEKSIGCGFDPHSRR